MGTTIGVVLMTVALAGCAKKAPPPQHAELAPEPPPVQAAPVEHDDGLNVQGTLGTLSDTEIEAAFHARWDDVTRCLKDAQPHLNYLAGRVELRLRVDASGTPTAVHVQSSTLGHYGAEQCLLTLASTVKFPAPRGGSAAEFSYPFEFKPARTTMMPVDWPYARVGHALDHPAVVYGACAAPASEPIFKRPLKKTHKHAVLKSTLAGLEPAKMRVTAYVLPGGHVSAAGLSADEPIAADVGACVVEHTRKLRFDDPGAYVANVSFEVGR